MRVFTDLGAKQAQAVGRVYGAECALVEANVFDRARHHCKDYDGGTWGFVTNDGGRVGFWYPLDHHTYKVSVPSNWYDNPEMQAVAFGAGLTLAVVNGLAWHFHDKGDAVRAQLYTNKYNELRDFVFGLGEYERDFIDTKQVAGFID